MTREQLDAIRARAAELGTCMTETTLLLAEVERLTAEVEAKVAQNVALVGMNGRLQLEVERLTAELHRMKSRPVEAEFSRLDTMWQQLVRERDEAVHELRRLTADPLPAAAWVREVEQAAFARGVAAMREAAASELDRLLTARRATAIWVGPDELRALPDPEDTE